MCKTSKLSHPDPKNVTYQKNGTGRDTYISFNNGGVLKDQYFITGGFERGQLPWKRQYAGNALPVRAKMTHYNVNGSGRDTYIGQDQGGFSYMDQIHTDSGRQTFVSSLRRYARSISRPESAYQPADTSGLRMGRTLLKSRQRRMSLIMQRDSVERLSQAKTSIDPYGDFRTHTSTIYK